MRNSEPRGFTLIELSVVLVVVGLIAGGVLVGRDLIQAARYRAVLGEQRQLETAVAAFEMQFNCTPGDCPRMTRYYPANPTCNTSPMGDPSQGVCNGGGDGQICGPNDMWYCGAHGFEVLYAAHHLRVAGLVNWPLAAPLDISVQVNGLIEATPGRNIFASPAWKGMGWGLQSSNAFTPPYYWYSAICPGTIHSEGGSPNANQMFFVGNAYSIRLGQATAGYTLSGAAAMAIDRKADDGKPFTGSVVALNNPGVQGWYTTLAGGCDNPDLSSGVYVDDEGYLGLGLIFVTNF